MACPVRSIGEVAPHKHLKRCETHGIAWVEDGTTGTAVSAHPNISGTGRPRALYGKGARIVSCHGWAYNTSSGVIGGGDLDEIAVTACQCGGTH